MELQQLRYVLAVADTGNFTRAADFCHVAQPSLSQQVINLEKELGQKLFHRLGRKAVLTEAGTAFLDRARRILFEVDDATREIKDSHNLDRSINVGAIPTLAPTLLPPVIALCRTQFPNLVINVREDFRDEQIRGVVEGELDLALISMPVKDTRVSVETLLTEPLMLVLSKQHPLASRPKIQVEDIKKERFVLLGGGSTLSLEVQRFCGDNQFEPNVVSTCAQIATVKALVALNGGISILPKGTITPEDRASLIVSNLDGRTPTRDIGVVRHPQRYRSKGAEQFLRLLREHTKKPSLAGAQR